MGWKDGKKPDQYLFTVTESFSEDWDIFKKKAKKNNRNISDALRTAVNSDISKEKPKK